MIKRLAILIGLFALVFIAPALALTTSTSVYTALIDPLLNNKTYLTSNGYLAADNQIPIIIQMNVPKSLTITSEYTIAKSAIINDLIKSGTTYKIGYDLQIIASFSARVDYSTLTTIAANSNVKRINLDRVVQGMLQTSIPLIQANDTWVYNDSNNISFKGDGVTVAIIDSGINCNHEALLGKTLVFKDYVNGTNGTSNCYDDTGHGTEIAGIVGASGKINGTAPNVKFSIYKVLDSTNHAPESRPIAAIQEAVGNGSKIISLSLGYVCFDSCNPSTDSLEQIVDEASNNSLIIVAAGNSGGNLDGTSNVGSVDIPGVSANVLTVGASFKKSISSPWESPYKCWDNNTINSSKVACFSSRGPTWDNRTKPDIVAPGVEINTTLNNIANNKYGLGGVTGTSFSTPHVTGVAALVLQKHPTWNSSQIKNKIIQSAVNLGLDPNTQGAGRVNALNAIDDAAPTVTSFTINGGSTSQQYTNSTSLSLQWSCTDPSNSSDPYTGIRSVTILKNGGSPQTFSVSQDNGTNLPYTLISGDSNVTLSLSCTDKGGNPSNNSRSANIYYDNIPPQTDPTPSSPDSWYNTDVSVTLRCTDVSQGNSGCNETRYCIDSGSVCINYQNYTGPIVFQNGNNTIRYFSIDKTGNSEIPKSNTYRIDKTPPILTSDYDSNNGSIWLNSNKIVQFTFLDSLSGVGNLKFTNGTIISNPYRVIVSDEGQYTYNFIGYDVAGNNITTSLAFKIDKTPPNTIANYTGTINGNWYSTTGSFTLMCIDPISGCNSSWYSINNGSTTMKYINPVPLNDGSYNITYYSIDNATNKEVNRTTQFNVDSITPVITITSPSSLINITKSTSYPTGAFIYANLFGPVTAGSVNVSADVSAGSSGIANSTLLIDGQVYTSSDKGLMTRGSTSGSKTTFTKTWNPDLIGAKHNVTIIATSTAGKTSNKTLQVSVILGSP